MAIVYDVATLDRYMTQAVDASPEHPVLIDKFLEDAFEFDVDAVADATGAVVIGGIMEHIEEAGIHSGDSSCVVPPFICPERHLATIRDYTRRIARALKVVGLMNVQYATKDDVVYVLEVNPRASRTVPYLSKATGVSLAKVAAKVMAGRTLAELGLTERPRGGRRVREEPGVPVRPVPRRRHDSRAEMKSTGEVMGGSSSFGVAFAKAQLVGRAAAAGERHGVRQRQQRRQGEPAADCARPGGARVPADRDARHGRLPARLRPRRRRRLQGERRAAERRRRDRQPQGRSDRQHAARPRVVLRRSRGAPRRDDARGAVHHHADRRRRRRQRHPRAARAGRRRARAAGLLRRNCRRRASSDRRRFCNLRRRSTTKDTKSTKPRSKALSAVLLFVSARLGERRNRVVRLHSRRRCVTLQRIPALGLLAGAALGLLVPDTTVRTRATFCARPAPRARAWRWRARGGRVWLALSVALGFFAGGAAAVVGRRGSARGGRRCGSAFERAGPRARAPTPRARAVDCRKTTRRSRSSRACCGPMRRRERRRRVAQRRVDRRDAVPARCDGGVAR